MKKFIALAFLWVVGLSAQTKFVKSVPTLAELVALNPADIHTNVMVNAYWIGNTNSIGAIFQYVPTSTDTTNTTTVFKPTSYNGRWIRVELPANPGSATQPGFRFLGDDNTGIYTSGADAIDFSTGGSRRWGITSTGVLQAQGGQSISTTASSLTLSPSGSVVLSPGGSSKWTVNSASGNIIGTAGYGGIYGGSGVPLSLNSGSGTDAVTMTINGTEGARLATTGYLGVGTTGPDRRVDSLDANNLQYRATFTDGSVYSDWGTLSTGATLSTNSAGHRTTSTTVNDTAVLARQVQGGLAFDGVTTTASDSHYIGSDIGTSDMSLSVTFLVPTVNPSIVSGIAYLSSSSTSGNVARSLYISIDASGNLQCVLNGSSSSLFVYKTTPIVSVYGGKIITATFVKNVSAVTMTVYINGVALTLSDVNSATPPTWADQILSSYFNLGRLTTSFYAYSGSIYSATLFNRALSASEVVTLANQGVQEADKWGSLTPTYNSNRAGGFDTGTDSFTADGTTIAGNVDGIGGQDDNLSITSTATTGNHRAFRVVSLTVGKKYRVAFSYYMSASTNAFAKQLNIIPFSGNAYPITSPAEATWTTVTLPDFTYTGIGTTLIVRMADNSGNTTFTGNATDVVYVRGITVTPIGSILDADLSAGVGYQVPDRSSNKYHGVVSATGTAWTLPNRRGQIRYTTTGATTGAFQLLSSTAIPANALIQSIVAWSAGTPLVYVGNATGTSNIAVHTTLAASTYTKLALTNDFSTTGNLWLNKSATNEVNLTVNYMIADP